MGTFFIKIFVNLRFYDFKIFVLGILYFAQSLLAISRIITPTTNFKYVAEKCDWQRSNNKNSLNFNHKEKSCMKHDYETPTHIVHQLFLKIVSVLL